MPDLSDYQKSIAKIWENQWLTNYGPFYRQFQVELMQYMQVEHLTLFNNGTNALMVALQALRINSGEVITTPFTFAATSHVLYWNNIKPVFCDIEPETFNIDPGKIENLIGPDTKAIMPVHVYGNPCDMKAIEKIAQRHGLFVIYDAAHAFGVQLNNRPLSDFGDISAYSFHATKLFSTIEGGALVSNSKSRNDRVHSLSNFGIANEETVIGPGINGKMNEMQASFGLLELQLVENEIAKRQKIAIQYRKFLKDIPGVRTLDDIPGVKHNYAYFPILIDAELYGTDRDNLNIILRKCNIIPRKYFYPLCSHYPCYRSLASANPDNLAVAEKTASQVLCLPMYGALTSETVDIICQMIKSIHEIYVTF
ncbi:MAG: DegT/DnrJ/EryC1/StrS family aminotransferase [Phycisphaerae bacterium]|nr:DegT/DnrJ/EryC1/StrS family aminotransferase [Phycisphaerae bacterium]